MITQVQYSERSRMSSTSSLSSQQSDIQSAQQAQMRINNPNQYLKQIEEEQETYNQLSELECFEILNELKKLRIEEESLKDKRKIETIDLNSKIDSFIQLQGLEVQKVDDIFKRESEQTGDYIQLFENQIEQEEQSYSKLQKQMQNVQLKIDRLNYDIGNI